MHMGQKKISKGTFWSAFMNLFSDLEDTFRFVEPVSKHLSVYSLRYYELLLRAATEFESVCKNEILRNSLSSKKRESLSIKDYYKLEKHLKGFSKDGPVRQLANWKIGFHFDPILYRQPLSNWKSDHKLSWYQDYNEVKHNRQQFFEKASLANVLDAIGSLFIILMNLDYSWTSSEWRGEKLWKSDGSVIYFDPDWPVCAKINYTDLIGKSMSSEFIKEMSEKESEEPWRRKY